MNKAEYRMRRRVAWMCGILCAVTSIVYVVSCLPPSHSVHTQAHIPALVPTPDSSELKEAKEHCSGNGCLLTIGKMSLITETKGEQKSHGHVPTGIYDATYLSSTNGTVFLRMQGVGPTKDIHGIFEMPTWDFVKAYENPWASVGQVNLGDKPSSQRRFTNTKPD